MSRRRQAPVNPSWSCEVVCTDGHLPGKLATFTYVPEDVWGWDTTEDFIAGRSTIQIRKGARVSAGGRFIVRRGHIVGRKASSRDRVREVKPDGGTKVRLHCNQCGYDLPISWENLDPIVERLWHARVSEVQLRSLGAMLESNSREAGLS